MVSDLRRSYHELKEFLDSEIGEQVVVQLAERRYKTGITSQATNLERGIILQGMPSAVAYFAISDFLDLCFGRVPGDMN